MASCCSHTVSHNCSFSLKNEGVIAVFPKITFMTSGDLKCVARKCRLAVRILLAIILVFT